MNNGSLEKNGAAAAEWDDRLLRSWLFVPAVDKRKLSKARGLRTDVLVLDLEDAVATSQKVTARTMAREVIPPLAAQAVVVRVNGSTSGLQQDDLEAVIVQGIGAVMLPKVENSDELWGAHELITEGERAAGMPPGAIKMLPMLETAAGIARCEAILGSAPARVLTAVFGSGDYATDLALDLTAHASELTYPRSRLVVATRAAGLQAPIDGPWIRLADADGLSADCARSRQLGFQGRVVLHPTQIDSVEQAYSELSDTELARARRIVEAFQDAQGRGIASLRVDDRFVDYPIYLRACEQLRRYEAWHSCAVEAGEFRSARLRRRDAGA